MILKICCEFHAVSHSLFGSIDNGSWNGLVAQIMNGEFDTAIPQLTPTTTRRTVLEFTNDFVFQRMILASRPESAHDMNFSTIFVFHPEIWVLILISAAIIASFAGVSIAFKRNYSRNKAIKAYSTDFLDSATVITGQSTASDRFLTTGARVALGILVSNDSCIGRILFGLHSGLPDRERFRTTVS